MLPDESSLGRVGWSRRATVGDDSFGRSSAVYDLLYAAAGKDYAAEADALHQLIQQRRPGATSLLDVACGTGAHLAQFADRYDVAGVDASQDMLAEAAARLPGVALTCGDMRSFDLGRRFDAVTCLFSAIAYMRSPAELDQAVGAMARHLDDGGVLVIDGWVRREAWRDPGMVQALSAHDDRTAAARVVRSLRTGNRTVLELHFVVGTLDGVDHITEVHELTLFDDREYRAAFERAGLAVDVVPSPHPDRDRYAGVRAR